MQTDRRGDGQTDGLTDTAFKRDEGTRLTNYDNGLVFSMIFNLSGSISEVRRSNFNFDLAQLFRKSLRHYFVCQVIEKSSSRSRKKIT